MKRKSYFSFLLPRVITALLIAAVLFYVAIKKLTTSDLYAFPAFLIVLFSPIMFSQVGARVYNMSVTPAAALLVVSSYIGLYGQYKNN